MARGNPVAADLVPPALAQVDLAHYRLLLPLRQEERDVYRPWSAFLPGGMYARDQLRNSDLEDLRHRALEAGQDMTGWDTCRGAVSEDFVHTLRGALEGFVPPHATWTLARWRGYRHEQADATRVTLRGLDCAQQVLDLDDAMTSMAELGVPDFMWSSTRQFGWGAPLYPDWGVLTVAAEDFVRRFAPRGFEAFSVPRDAVLPDNLGD
ncbi:hypothetical protein AABM36_02700 [Kocuria sp. KSNUG]|uniref:hypothetical protein n=1 Tax=Kocuria sp. KSNUG TaxID=3136676 RepID=UPI003C2E0943